MTDKLRQAAQQMLEAVADLTILTPREWQAVHGLKIDALRDELAEQPAEQEPVGEVAEVAQGYDEGWTAIIETGLRKLQKGDKVYTAPQPAKPAEQCWKCGDMDPSGHEKCDVPACGMREEPQPAKREPLTDEQISLMAHNDDEGDWNHLTYRDCWHEGYKAGARAIERAHGIGGQV